MIKPNADMTVIHSDGENLPKIVHISGVEWQEVNKVAVTNNGLKTADYVTVFIPKEHTSDLSLIKKTDAVVRGIKSYENLSGKELMRALERDGAVHIVSIVNNLDFSPSFLAHLELGCV